MCEVAKIVCTYIKHTSVSYGCGSVSVSVRNLLQDFGTNNNQLMSCSLRLNGSDAASGGHRERNVSPSSFHCCWPLTSLTTDSWDRDFLTRRAVSRAAELAYQHSLISLPITRRACSANMETVTMQNKIKNGEALIAFFFHPYLSTFSKAS